MVGIPPKNMKKPINSLTKKQLEQLKSILQCAYEDCEMALCNEWDRSDEGFKALRENLLEAAEILKIKLNVPYFSDKNKD